MKSILPYLLVIAGPMKNPGRWQDIFIAQNDRTCPNAREAFKRKSSKRRKKK